MLLEINSLPALNAGLNFLSFVSLVLGYLAIKRQQKEWHARLMIMALIWSALFLTSYLIYHYHAGSKPFPDLGWIKTFYLFILVPHIILAVVMVPMILKTFWHAYRQEFEQHKKWARWTFPIWIYVSITGVVIYFMLYQWFKTA